MSTPLAYLLTWTTYGTWLPGDGRGWVDKHKPGLIQKPNPTLQIAARNRMKEPPVILNSHFRQVVAETISQTCDIRDWTIHALAVQSNHVHVVICTPNTAPKQAMGVLKANSSRVLNKKTHCQNRKRWWTEGGSVRYLNTKNTVLAAIEYVGNQ
jgi:REP element-mobilizing transposase RayT